MRLIACASVAVVAAAIATAAASANVDATNSITLSIDIDKVLHVIEAGWPGVNIDTASIHNGIDFTDPYLRTIASQLYEAAPGAPVMLRIGGTASDHSIFLPGAGPAYPTHGGGTVLTDGTLKSIDDFATAVGARVLFGIPYITDARGVWDASNATAIWASVTSQKLHSFFAWSLGNEIIGGTGFNDTQYGLDYLRFRAETTAQAPDWAQAIFGPSPAGFPGPDVIGPFMATTAAALAQDGGGLSLHAYAFKNCSLDVYMSKSGMERMDYYFSNYAGLRDSLAPGLPLYLEEFATSAGGGCDGLSNRYVSTLWYMHTLGLAGKRGIARVTRQDLVGWSFSSGMSHYPLAGPPGWVTSASDGLPTPHPDYFTTLLWRQVVGAASLSVTVGAPPAVNASVGVHAWCAGPSSGAPSRAVVLTFINTGAEPIQAQLEGGLADAPRLEWILTPPGGNLTADAVLINGSPLTVDGSGKLPELPVPGASVTASDSPIVLPPFSAGFLVLSAAAAPACM